MSIGQLPDAKPHEPWTADDSTLAARLVLVRGRMEWNRKEAARECGISAGTWLTWERGVKPQGTAGLERIAARTGCDLMWLITGQRPKEAAA